MKTYWLIVYSNFDKPDSGNRYCLWCYDELDQSEPVYDTVYHYNSKSELRILMDLIGLKVMHYDLIIRDSKHNNKISRVYFPLVNTIKDN